MTANDFRMIFSYYPYLNKKRIKRRQDKKEVKRILRGFNLVRCKDSVFSSKKFTDEFGPSFDCMGMLSKTNVLVAQYQRNDRDQTKTFAVVEFESENDPSKAQFNYLKWKGPYDGKWFRLTTSSKDMIDVFMGTDNIYLRANGKPELHRILYLSKNIQDLRRESKDTSMYKIDAQFENVDFRYPRMMTMYMNKHLLFITASNHFCSLKISLNPEICVNQANVLALTVNEVDILLFNDDNSCPLEILNQVDFPLIEYFKTNIDPKVLKTEVEVYRTHYGEERRRVVVRPIDKQIEESQKLRRMKNGGKVPIPRLKQRRLHKVVSDPGFMILPFYIEEGGYNELYFCRVYGNMYEVLHRQRIRKLDKTDRIIDGKIFKSVHTYGAVRCALLLEARSYHLVYYNEGFAGMLLENKPVSHSEDAEIYGYFNRTSRSIVLYGWDICVELAIQH